ncbi:MAG: hypothetical protein L6Q76_38220, partial [Polyangiaceae bacterium]|nr:hypothetical protein [Polyangiaceae bacterium]
VSGVCTSMCCEDKQCENGYCDKTLLTGKPHPIGVCMAGMGGAGGAGGAGGMGGEGGAGGLGGMGGGSN